MSGRLAACVLLLLLAMMMGFTGSHFVLPVMPAAAQDSQAAFDRRVAAWRGGQRSEDVRQRILDAAARLNPPPALPPSAQALADRAVARFKVTPATGDHGPAVADLKAAIDEAPWGAHLYFNLGLIQEAARDYEGATVNLGHYLRAVPGAADRRRVEKKIAELQVKADIAGRETAARRLYGRANWRSLKPIKFEGRARTNESFALSVTLGAADTARVALNLPGAQTYNFEGRLRNGAITAEFTDPKHSVNERGSLTLRTVGDLIEANIDFRTRAGRYSYFDYLGR